MSGVVDRHGQQWEHCCHCGKFVRIQDLTVGYSPKWPDYEWVDLCRDCKRELTSPRKRTIVMYTHWDGGCAIRPYHGGDPEVAGDFCHIRGQI